MNCTDTLKVGIVQSHPVFSNLTDTRLSLEPQLEDCATQGAKLVILPELAGSGYCFPDKSSLRGHAETNDCSGTFLSWLAKQAEQFGYAIIAGYPELGEGDSIFNSAAFITESGMIGNYRKLHLFHNEKSLFKAGNKLPQLVNYQGFNIATLICFDWAFPEVWRSAALAGADLVAHPSNLVLPWAQTACRGHALCNRFDIATANRIGAEDNHQDKNKLVFTGQSQMLSPFAEVMGKAPRAETWQSVFELHANLARDKKPTDKADLFTDRRSDLY